MDDAPLPLPASTSIVIPSAGRVLPGSDTTLLERCLSTLTLLDPPPAEVIVVVGDEYQGEPPRPVAGLGMRVIHRGAGPFDFSRAVNRGLLASRGELMLMLNDDIEAESPNWLGLMAACLRDPTVGAVGAALLYPDRSIQHIGIEFDHASPVHSLRGRPLSEAAGLAGDAAREVVSVTGACLLARRRDLLAVGGMSCEFPSSYGDIDLCLRLRRSGLRVVVAPAAVLTHHESASRAPVIEPWETERFLARWGEAPDSPGRPIAGGSESEDDQNYDSPMPADPADGGDHVHLHQEILRLRDRAQGAEAQNQHLHDRVANLHDRVANLQDRVANLQDRIAELEGRVGERDARIADHLVRINERDVRLSEKDALIAGKDQRVAELEAENQALRAELARPAVIRFVRRITRRPRTAEPS